MSKSLQDSQIEALCEAFSLDPVRALHASALCDGLFAQTAHLHGLTKTSRPLMQAGAVLFTATDQLGARKLTSVLKRALPESAPIERNIVIQALNSNGTTGDAPQAVQDAARRIAAIVQVANGLVRQRGPGCRLVGVVDDGEALDILVTGEDARQGVDSTAGETFALWNDVALRPIRGVRCDDGRDLWTGLFFPFDSIAEAGRRTFQRQTEQLMSRAYGLAGDWDVEYVHEMRVAIRRMRAALGGFRKALGPEIAAFKDDMKWLADALGFVRDADVFELSLRGYAPLAPEEHQPFLNKLIRRVRSQRREHYRGLLDAVQSARYGRFIETFYSLARAPLGSEGGLPEPSKKGRAAVSNVAPRMLLQRLNRLTGYPRRLELSTSDEQHALRIECKRMRYSAELFADIYPGRLIAIIEPMVKMQDALGEVHDCDVYTERIICYSDKQRRGREDVSAKNAEHALLGALRNRRIEALEDATSTWRAFTGKKSIRGATAAIKRPLPD